MRLKQYLNELSSIYGKGITFIDIDESIFHTMARIFVINDKTGKIVKKLSNQDFNTYKLEKGFSYDFREFRDSAFFQRTSKPIPQTINRIKRMFKNIDVRGSKVVLLTARETFPSMKEFKDTFRKQGIPIDKIEIKFAGDI